MPNRKVREYIHAFVDYPERSKSLYKLLMDDPLHFGMMYPSEPYISYSGAFNHRAQDVLKLRGRLNYNKNFLRNHYDFLLCQKDIVVFMYVVIVTRYSLRNGYCEYRIKRLEERMGFWRGKLLEAHKPLLMAGVISRAPQSPFAYRCTLNKTVFSATEAARYRVKWKNDNSINYLP